MRSKRGSSGLCGVLAIDKPAGMTSHDVVDRVRRITGERRVGHAGTLDPAATGLMLVGVGAATRLSEYLTGHDKRYEARIAFGVATDTDDAEGRVLDVGDIDAACADMTHDRAQAVLDCFTGELDQLPPAFSAIKKNGTVAYKAAREGASIELDMRKVTVHAAQLVKMGSLAERLRDSRGDIDEYELPCWDVSFHVSKGTYIRALARDMGAYLGCGAHLASLRRTSIATVDVDEASTLEELERIVSAGEPIPWCDPAGLLGFPVIELCERQARSVANGAVLDGVSEPSDGLVSCVRDDRLLAVYNWSAGSCRPATVIPGGVVGVG